MKKCNNCFKTKPLSEFYVRRAQNDHQSRCKECSSEVSCAYRKMKRDYELGRFVPNYRETRQKTVRRKKSGKILSFLKDFDFHGEGL